MELPTEAAEVKRWLGPKKPRPQAVPFETINLTSKQYQDPRDRFLFCWLYLTGQRVSEALSLTRKEVIRDEIQGKPFLMVDSPTEKNTKSQRRKIPVPLFGFEAGMTEYVWDVISGLKPDVKLSHFTRQQAFNHLSRVSIQCEFIDGRTRPARRFTGLLSINPHYLRHCRADHMTHNHGFDNLRLMQFFGWASSSMPNVYITNSGVNLAEGLIHQVV